MTENEAKELVKKLRNKAELFKNSGFAVDGIVKSFEDSANAIETLSEAIQQYRAIGLTPELIEAMQGHNVALINDLGEYQAIGTVEEFKALKEKTTPKKVVWKFVERLSNETVYECFCPTCNVKLKAHEHHCECGQSLNWRKE